MKKYLELINNYSIRFLLTAFLAEIKRKVWQERILGSYSQIYEDLEIEKLLQNKKEGRYLEIGAYQPKRLSNTYRFYKKGWTGIVIEPNPQVKELFESVRPRDKFLNIGISESGGNLKYYQYLIPALNTFKKTNNKHKVIGITNIKTKKITEVVKENFDFLSIDTEGLDAIILKSWPWGKFRPKVICVETDKTAVDQILKKYNYRLMVKNKFNSIYKLEL